VTPGEDADRSTSEVRLSVPGMDCPSCAARIEQAIARVDGLATRSIDPATGTVRVDRDPDRARRADAIGAVEAAGYEVADDEQGTAASKPASVWTSSRSIRAATSGVLLAIAGAWLMVGSPAELGLPGPALTGPDVLFLAAVVLAGREIFAGGLDALGSRNLDIDLLMSVAILGALAASVVFGEDYYFEAAMLASLFSFAELLEGHAMQQARGSLRELMDLAPDEATVRRDGDTVTVPVDAIEASETVLVRPGEKIPMDGRVIEGDSAVNQAPITGESLPVDKTPGDEVYAGTINQEGYLQVEATGRAEDNTLSRIVEMVEDANAAKTERERFVDRFSSAYTPAVVVAGLSLAIVPPLVFGASWPTFIVYGLTLLVLACPCAFVISTPVSVVSGVTSGARNGVLIKGGRHLEAMGEIEAVALDKTGTVTRGELTVTDVIPLNGHTEEEVLRCARGVETRSEHPIGEAIVERAEADDVPGREVGEFEAITGRGVKAALEGDLHYAGAPDLFEQLGFDLGHVHAATDEGTIARKTRQICERNDCLDLIEDLVPKLQAQGKTVVLVGTDEHVEGVIALADEVRREAESAIRRLRELGVDEVVMLTGDDEATARAVAERVGIDEVRAGLLPEDKVEAVEALDERFGGVAMVGDGINDAPALAQATVGVAMGAAGTDTALETADVALMGDDLRKLPYLYELSSDANGVIRQNISASLVAKAGLALAVPFGYVPIWLAVLVGDAGMTLGITANATRLARVRPDA